MATIFDTSSPYPASRTHQHYQRRFRIHPLCTEHCNLLNGAPGDGDLRWPSDIVLLMELPPVCGARLGDAAEILALRTAIEDWLAEQGIQQWGHGLVQLADIKQQITAGEWHLVRGPQELLGALRLLWSDEPVWQHDNTQTAYVHGLMLNRAHAGRGVGAELLNWAEPQARIADAPALRLDCVESNLALRSYYEQRGFRQVARRDFDGLWPSAVLLQKTLR